jgi:hypothetical protein
VSEFASSLKDFLLAIQTLGPWGVVFFLWYQGQKDSKKWEERFMAVKQMYENNVKLVECYEAMAKNFQDLVIYNTQSLTKVNEKIDANLFCPIVRKRTQQKEIEEVRE